MARDLNALISFIHRGSSRHFFTLTDELELTITQCKTLHRLDNLEPQTSVKELAEMLGLSLPAASRTVESLSGRGLLDRREDEHDRRVKRVALTAAGREVVTRLNGARFADLRGFVSTLTDDERAHMTAALKALLSRTEIAAYRSDDAPS